ncbi:uncharacterized protein At2g29880-like [Salvia miltiorrhiza]|uniref:uncharacterized protein At2g29880-like n=1 Tax=Salvia miltiorrhiza TaxID=226208 RepID=UPI0025ACAE1E|nr:uncharacterized protein At2g29880-like [Salvia miltiorrhiza]
MGDSQPQDSKKRAVYEAWTQEQSDALLRILAESAIRGWRDNSGIFSKATVEERILHVLNEKLRSNKNYNHYQSRIKWFKSCWNAYSKLLKFNSGFGYDNDNKKFTAPDEVWDAYIEAHPKDAYLRTGSFSDYDELRLAVGNGVAVGRNAIGVGSATDARTIGVDESRGPLIEEFNYDTATEAFVVLGEDDPLLSASKSPLEPTEVPVESTQRRAPAKRSRGQFETNSGHTESSSHQELMVEIKKVTSTMDRVESLFVKRDTMMEKREKEKSFTTWDAILEIPDLSEDDQYTAFDLLVTKSQKDGFMKMTVPQRKRWIEFKTRK